MRRRVNLQVQSAKWQVANGEVQRQSLKLNGEDEARKNLSFAWASALYVGCFSTVSHRTNSTAQSTKHKITMSGGPPPPMPPGQQQGGPYNDQYPPGMVPPPPPGMAPPPGMTLPPVSYFKTQLVSIILDRFCKYL